MYTQAISILLFVFCAALVAETQGQQRGGTETVAGGGLPPAADTIRSLRGEDSLRAAITEDSVPLPGNDTPVILGRQVSAPALFIASVPMMSVADRLREGVPSTVGSTAGSPWRPRVGLVLSGGGARGIAQVGVLRALEEAGIRPDFIVGTSIGSIIGGLYASGYNARRLETAIREIDWSRALRLSDEADRSVLSVDQKSMSDRSILTLRFDGLQPVIPQAVSKGQRLTNLLNELTLQGVYHAEDFDRLGIPFRAVATDLHTGRSVVLRDGSLAECLRASATIPVMYAAVRRDSMLLVDGGLLANIPTDVAVDAGCEFIIAVNTTSPMRPAGNMETALEIVDQILNVVMIPHSEAQLELADLVITPQLGAIMGTDFAMADSLIRLGYEAGRAAAEQLSHRFVDAAVARMERPPQLLASYQPRALSDEQSDDPWFARPQTLDDIYHKAVRIAQDNRYSDVAVLLDAHDGSAVIRAGRTQRITSVRVTGSTLLPMAVIIGIETRWTGASVSADIERELSEYILEDYRSRGYSLASIDSFAVDRYGKVLVRIDEGVVGRITVSGNTRTNPVVILRELPMREGEIFRLSDMKRGMDNLLALNLFHHVAYDMRDSDGRTDIVIRVVERPSQELQAGLLVDNERNAQVGLQLRDANLFGTGTEIAAAFFSGQSNREYALRYSTNRMFYTPFSMQLRGHYGFRDYNNYENVLDLPDYRFEREVTFVYRRISYGASASFGLNVQRFGNLLGALRIEQQQIRTDQIRTLTVEPISEDHRLVELSLSTTIDTQDRYPYPQNGVHFTAEYSSAQTALGSETAFTRLQAEYEFYVTVIPDVIVAHPRFLFGYGDKTMPRTEEFRLGGLYSFMGMRENEFNGRQIALVSLELRYTSPLRILFDTYFSVRYDLGRTWLNPELIKLGDLRHGVGMQIGLDTPIGPADFGIGRSFYFVRNNPDRSVKIGALNLYFSIGARL